MTGSHKGLFRLLAIDLVDAPDFLCQARLLAGHGDADQRLSQSDATLMLSSLRQDRIDDVQRLHRAARRRQPPPLQRFERLGVRRVALKDLLVKREGVLWVFERTALELCKAEGRLTAFDAVALLSAPQLQRKGQLLRVLQLRVEAFEGERGLAIERIALG